MPQARSFKSEVCLRLSNKSESKDHIKVGHIKRAHGIRGELFASLPSGEKTWVQAKKKLIVQKKNETDFVEFEVEKAKLHKEGFILKLVSVEDRNQAESFKGATLWVPSDQMVSRPGEKIYLQEVMGFVVFDHQEKVGRVQGFMDNGAQDLLRVHSEESEFLIPFIEIFITKIDFDAGEIYMELPEGLLE